MKYATNTLEYQWMPFTANREFKADPRLLVKGEGVHFWNHKGERLLDGSSGLFCSALGHCRPEIAEAVYQQLQELDRQSHLTPEEQLERKRIQKLKLAGKDQIARILSQVAE